MRRFLKVAGGFAAALALLIAIAAGWFWRQLNASIPAYEGELTLTGLSERVVVERDPLGVATIQSSDPVDEARALGFVHAQERFFQMDLLRRSGAGEVSALFGAAAVQFDEERRVHLLRDTAERVLNDAPAGYRGVLEAYAEGVNAGLDALGAKPFEYLLLRAEPSPWVAADSVLVAGAMYFDLEDDVRGLRKRNELVARSILPSALADVLYPSSTVWDAPLVGDAGAPASLPGPETYDLRRLPRELFGRHVNAAPEASLRGSNNWAVAGSQTTTGRALLANDPHLALRVPAIWFRTSLVRDGRRVTGVSLPGWPRIVLGSNGNVAWGFTNSYGDWHDLIVLELDPEDPSRYRTPDGWAAFETVPAPIEVAGGSVHEFAVRRTIWGPVIGALPDGTPFAVRWLAHDPRGYVDGFGELAQTRSALDAVRIAQRSAIPPQNFVAADAEGNVGWTIMGAIPRRVRHGGVSRSGQGSAWQGWLEPDEYPLVLNPPHGRIWTANARVVGGAMLEAVGDGGYLLGARARQIRDRLMAIEGATPADMLRVQLDDEALFLARWRDDLLALTDGVADPVHRAVREAIRTWGGHAAIDSVGYRLVREWRNVLIGRMLDALFVEVLDAAPSWRYIGARAEHWAWPLASEQPLHLLDPRFESWRAFKLAALDELLRELNVASPADLAERTWGDYNRARVRHPLSQAVPLLSGWLDMPATAQAGDTRMPRVQTPEFGASARFAVSPGDEINGYFHMPGGQSGHPRSPYYGAGHADWAAARPTPFLPGPAERTLTLLPRAARARPGI